MRQSAEGLALPERQLHSPVMFQKVNQFITQKEKLLRQLDRYNRQQNEKFSQQMFGVAPCKNAGPAPTVAAPPAELPPNFPGGEFPPDGLPQVNDQSNYFLSHYLLPR